MDYINAAVLGHITPAIWGPRHKKESNGLQDPCGLGGLGVPKVGRNKIGYRTPCRLGVPKARRNEMGNMTCDALGSPKRIGIKSAT